MKTQDFVCPYCGWTVEAREIHPPSSGDYYYPAESVGVVKIQGYHWIAPDVHYRNYVPCEGSELIYYVGDANL